MTDQAVPFQTGQRVKLREQENGCWVTVLSDDPADCMIVEVGPDYLLLEDAPAEVRQRIPMYLVRRAPVEAAAMVEATTIESPPAAEAA
jgi:hypothetical protein